MQVLCAISDTMGDAMHRTWLMITALLSLFASIIAAELVNILLTERISIYGDTVGLQYSLNSGIAFGIRLPPVLQSVLIAIAFIVVATLAIHTANNPRSTSNVLSPIAFGLILGGGVANIIDRLQDGYVTDFVQIGWWPIFNVADSCVTVGVVLLLWIEVRGKH